MPSACARFVILSSSLAVRLKLSCSQRGSDFLGRPMVACSLAERMRPGVWGPLAGPQRDLLPKQKDISLPSSAKSIYSVRVITPIVTICISHSLSAVFTQLNTQTLFSKHHV